VLNQARFDFEDVVRAAVGDHFILLNTHDPLPLRAKFEAEFAGACTWEYLENSPEAVRIKITKLRPPAKVWSSANAAVPRIESNKETQPGQKQRHGRGFRHERELAQVCFAANGNLGIPPASQKTLRLEVR